MRLLLPPLAEEPRRCRSALSCAITPPITSGRQRQVGWVKNFGPWTTAPPWGPRPRTTTRPMRAWLIAPAHMAQGSKVTTKVRSVRATVPQLGGGDAHRHDLGVGRGIMRADRPVAARRDHLAGGRIQDHCPYRRFPFFGGGAGFVQGQRYGGFVVSGARAKVKPRGLRRWTWPAHVHLDRPPASPARRR